ncbi:hypothetical protein H1C71_021168 [Ictidomys tridecemlineatus]|nr:hypothetical protein H1C71_021168 [Ictidomys tridecemlineatus]
MDKTVFRKKTGAETMPTTSEMHTQNQEMPGLQTGIQAGSEEYSPHNRQAPLDTACGGTATHDFSSQLSAHDLLLSTGLIWAQLTKDSGGAHYHPQGSYMGQVQHLVHVGAAGNLGAESAAPEPGHWWTHGLESSLVRWETLVGTRPALLFQGVERGWWWEVLVFCSTGHDC